MFKSGLRPYLILGVVLLLFAANYYYWDGGLITIDATDQPAEKVIRSIEWQGWVKIYSNAPPDQKVTLHVTRVTLPVALDQLAQKNKLAWNLAFFAADSPAAVKDAIQCFETGKNLDHLPVYVYPTMLQLIGRAVVTSSDPRMQDWPGLKVPDAQPINANPGETPSAPTPSDATATIQTQLRDFAESANIWIMSPDTWNPPVVHFPPPNPSISQAVKKFVADANGSVTEAIIVRTGRGGPAGNKDSNYNDMLSMAGRLRNAVNGLPPDERDDARASIDEETKFYQSLQGKPPDEQHTLARKHVLETLLYSDRLLQMSPEDRAKYFARKVAARQAAAANPSH